MPEEKSVHPQPTLTEKSEPAAAAETPGARPTESKAASEQEAPSKAQTPAAEPQQPQKGPSRIRRFFRRLLWWLAFILFLFFAGFLTAVVLLVQPREQRLFQMHQELRAAQATQQALNEELNQRAARIQELEQRIQELETQLQQAQEAQKAAAQAQALQAPYIHWLQTLRYGYRALLALQQGDTLAARIALQSAQKHLEQLGTTVPEPAGTTVQTLQQRLQDLLPQLAADEVTQQKLSTWLARLEEIEPLLRPQP